MNRVALTDIRRSDKGHPVVVDVNIFESNHAPLYVHYNVSLGQHEKQQQQEQTKQTNCTL